jgi:hypothetical protein
MTIEPSSSLVKLFLAFAALGCGAGALITAALLAVNVLG